jgi:hypothetical protein
MLKEIEIVPPEVIERNPGYGAHQHMTKTARIPVIARAVSAGAVDARKKRLTRNVQLIRKYNECCHSFETLFVPQIRNTMLFAKTV